MSNVINEEFKERILEDVLELKGNDIWNVIFAIEREFGIANLPSPEGGEEGFINALVELRFEEALI
tara:strand:+ start:310 stop:507 length:198 start_codon:yes stop_codon:yes gene_type:complete